MLKIEHELETPIEPNYYKNEINRSILQEPDKNQATTN